jgi:hypothetical protein
MFGRMMVTPIAQVGTDADLQTAIGPLLRAAEQADIVRCRHANPYLRSPQSRPGRRRGSRSLLPGS